LALNRLAISRSALGTWELLFMIVKYDFKKNPKSKVSKTVKEKDVLLPHLVPP
jgi:hypothetical protein